MNTEMFWSASGAMTDLAILVTPMGCELEKLPPPDTTFKASQVASATLRCSEEGSSVRGGRGTIHGRQACDGWELQGGDRAGDRDGDRDAGQLWDSSQPPPSGLGALLRQRRMGSEVPSREGRAGKASEDLRRARLLGRAGTWATSGFSVWGFYCLNHGMTGLRPRVMILSPGPTTLLAVRGCPQMGATGPLLFFWFFF